MAALEPKPRGQQPGRIVRRTSRAATGGAALLLAFLALMVLRLGGGGSGDPDGNGQSGSAGEATAAARPPLVSTAPDGRAASRTPATPPPAASLLSADEQQALSGPVLTVLIDEHSYLIQLPSETQPVYRPADLQRVLQLAELTRGDTNGIRVRIVRRENARASAEEQLKLDLSRRGIGSNAVHMSEDFVP